MSITLLAVIHFTLLFHATGPDISWIGHQGESKVKKGGNKASESREQGKEPQNEERASAEGDAIKLTGESKAKKKGDKPLGSKEPKHRPSTGKGAQKSAGPKEPRHQPSTDKPKSKSTGDPKSPDNSKVPVIVSKEPKEKAKKALSVEKLSAEGAKKKMDDGTKKKAEESGKKKSASDKPNPKQEPKSPLKAGSSCEPLKGQKKHSGVEGKEQKASLIAKLRKRKSVDHAAAKKKADAGAEVKKKETPSVQLKPAGSRPSLKNTQEYEEDKVRGGFAYYHDEGQDDTADDAPSFKLILDPPSQN